jgi:hypothetical protein
MCKDEPNRQTRLHASGRRIREVLSDAWYSGKHRDFGGYVQAVMRPTASQAGPPTLES